MLHKLYKLQWLFYNYLCYKIIISKVRVPKVSRDGTGLGGTFLVPGVVFTTEISTFRYCINGRVFRDLVSFERTVRANVGGWVNGGS